MARGAYHDWLADPRSAPYRPAIFDAARRFNVNPGVIAQQIGAESAFRPTVASGTGPKGIMQIARGTARDPGYGIRPISLEDRDNPDIAIPFGVQYAQARGGYTQQGMRAYSGGDYSPQVIQNILRGSDSYNADPTRYGGGGFVPATTPQGGDVTGGQTVTRFGGTNPPIISSGPTFGGQQTSTPAPNSNGKYWHDLPPTTQGTDDVIDKDGNASATLPEIHGEYKDYPSEPPPTSSRFGTNTTGMQTDAGTVGTIGPTEVKTIGPTEAQTVTATDPMAGTTSVAGNSPLGGAGGSGVGSTGGKSNSLGSASGAQQKGTGAGTTGGGGSGQGSAAGSGGAGSMPGFDIPSAINYLAGKTQQAGSQIGSDTKEASKTLGSDVKESSETLSKAAKTASTDLGSIVGQGQSFLGDIFVRGAIVVLALIFVAVGLALFGRGGSIDPKSIAKAARNPGKSAVKLAQSAGETVKATGKGAAKAAVMVATRKKI